MLKWDELYVTADEHLVDGFDQMLNKDGCLCSRNNWEWGSKGQERQLGKPGKVVMPFLG